MQEYLKIKELVLSAEDDANKFFQKDNKSAGRRLRKTMQAIKWQARIVRKAVSEKNK